ncbi:hypothetical protein D9619_001527 [Psilocybe cf. subviscida]|uniref:CUE domain-containing protein n=1 Tax=Psilocybe cf. subviscida TaxID=2480587 RepID=A0A8H5BDV1_9AGAR|nr:hypothetical protein D9619_001527 [Psilocybe cf. subviscida]
MSQPTSTNPFESSATSEAYAPPAGPPPGHSASPPVTEPSYQAPSDTADVTAHTVVTPPPPATSTGSPVPAASSPAPSNQSTRPVPSQSPAHTQSPPPQTAAQEREAVNDPRIIALRGMFPDYDDLILQSVLDSAGGNQDRAIDILLGMSDPDYRSEAPAQVQNPAPQLTQEQLDEQFARQLVMQEQQQQNQQWIQAQTDAGRPPPPVNYAVRPGAQTWQPQPGQQTWQSGPQLQQERPSEFQEQFTKIAETGKKTFGSLFSKVKAKIQEFETGKPVNASSSTPSVQQQQWTPPPQPAQQQAAYYDPNPAPRQVASPIQTPGVTPPPTQGVQGYDVSGSPPSGTTVQQQLQRQPSPSPAVVPPPSTTLDAAKFGLLPKRPVSLVRPDSGGAAGSSAPPPHPHHDDDSDDGLEYAENPFETDTATSATTKK